MGALVQEDLVAQAVSLPIAESMDQAQGGRMAQETEVCVSMRGEAQLSGDLALARGEQGGGVGEGEAMAGRTRGREGPGWLESFIKPDYFGVCQKHHGPERAGRTERNHFCLDCLEGPLCSAGLQTHAGHATLQTRKASYKDVVRLQDVQWFLNVDDIMVYNINASKILFLHSRPQVHHSKVQPRCIMCGREFLHRVLFCSMQCKLEAIRKRPYDASLTFFKPGVEPPGGRGVEVRGDSCSHEPMRDAAGRIVVASRVKVGRRSSSSASVQKNAGRRRGGRGQESEEELVEVKGPRAASTAAAKRPPRAPAPKRKRMPQKKIAVAVAAAAEPGATAAAALDAAIDTAAAEAAAGALAAAAADMERERERELAKAVERQRGTVRKRREAMKPPPPLLPRKRNAEVKEEEEGGSASGSDGGGRRSASPGSPRRVVHGKRGKSPAFSPTSVLAVPPWSRGADPPLPRLETEQPEEIVQTPPAVERRVMRRKATTPRRAPLM